MTNGAHLKGMRKFVWSNMKCLNCELLPLCRGGCRYRHFLNLMISQKGYVKKQLSRKILPRGSHWYIYTNDYVFKHFKL